MSATLAQLVEEARARIASGYYQMPMLVGKPKSLAMALKKERLQVIAEVKLASPSAGRIGVRSPQELLTLYLEGGAAGLSVLTEPDHFHGSMEDLIAAARSPLPVLMKDFVVDRRQIEAAAACGASAVLLIQEALRKDEVSHLISLAQALGLEVVLESSSAQGLEAAQTTAADIIALNQRDLCTMKVDATACARILPLIRKDERPLLVMSGIRSPAEAALARQHGADAILVGTALAEAKDPRALLRHLGVVG